MKKHTQAPSERGRRFYRIVPNDDGTVDVWLTPGEAAPMFDELTGQYDYNLRILAVRGVEPWPGLETDIRRRYQSWIESAEVIEI